MADRPAHNAAKNITPSLIGGLHAIANEESRSAEMIRQNTQADIVIGVGPINLPGALRKILEDGLE